MPIALKLSLLKLQRFQFSLFVLAMALLFASNANAQEPKLSVRVKLNSSVIQKPFSGGIYIFFSQSTDSDPRHGPNWFSPEPFLRVDVLNWKPDEVREIVFDPSVVTFPKNLKFSDLEGKRLQAVARLNTHTPDIGDGEGNAYSTPQVLNFNGTVIDITHKIPERVFIESERQKLFRVRSTKLSRFHGRDVFLQGRVDLPSDYLTASDKVYPVIYEIPGFGGDHFYGQNSPLKTANNSHGIEFIRVTLDPKCGLGHHVFANSANNGPYGDALVEEFIPALETAFRTAGYQGRFLKGHSSGGWSSLWLQVTYPDFFNGTWSTAPDPVDFRDFQRIDIYANSENMFLDESKQRRPLARRGTMPIVWYQDFSDMEVVLGDGGQLRSFEAVFSVKGEDGKPKQLWDRVTGEIDTTTASDWRAYDIRVKLAENWETLSEKLQGKLHVYMGTLDTFYLEGATQKLKESLENLGSDAVIRMIPDADHFNLFQDPALHHFEQQMADRFVAAGKLK